MYIYLESVNMDIKRPEGPARLYQARGYVIGQYVAWMAKELKTDKPESNWQTAFGLDQLQISTGRGDAHACLIHIKASTHDQAVKRAIAIFKAFSLPQG